MTEETAENTTNIESDSSIQSYTQIVSLPKTAAKIAKPSFNLSGKHNLRFKVAQNVELFNQILFCHIFFSVTSL